MKSIIIPHKHTGKNNTYSKIALLAAQLNITSRLEITTITAIYQVFKNNPIQPNKKTIENLKPDIIQIIQELTENQKHATKLPTFSGINNAIWKLVTKCAIVKIDGLFFLNSCFKDIDQVEQIVFRFS